MRKVYVCDAPFKKEEVDNLSDEGMKELKAEIEHFIEAEFTRSCPKWTAYEWLRYFMNKASPFEMVEAWNEFNKR